MASRITRGFHWLGLVIAVPLVLSAAIPLARQLFEPGGPPVPVVVPAPPPTGGYQMQEAVPLGASSLGYTNKVFDISPTTADIAPGMTGQFALFDGMFYDGAPDLSPYAKPTDGLVIPLNKQVVGQTKVSTKGTLPYLYGGDGFYVEFQAKCSDNDPENWPALWLMPAEHDANNVLGMRDIYWMDPGMDAAMAAGYERWMELDVDEGGFNAGTMGSVINWRGNWNQGGYTNTTANNVSSTATLDRTQWHVFGASYDGAQTVTWYLDNVQVFQVVGNGSLNGPISPAAATQQFFIIMGAQSHGTHNFTQTVRRVRAYQPTVSKNKRLVGYGDSLLYGTGVTNGNQSLTWRAKLANAMGRIDENHGVGGETSWNVADRFAAAAGFYDPALDIFVFEGGYNNYTNPAGQVESDVARMVAAVNALFPTNTAKYIVMGVPTGETPAIYAGGADRAKIDTINANLAGTYGARFLDINAILVAQYNPSIPQDVTDHNHGIVPSSLRGDLIHWNDAGNDKVYLAAQTKAQALGYMADGGPVGSRPRSPPRRI